MNEEDLMRNFKPVVRVYVAGSSDELGRVKEMQKMLSGSGFTVTSKWVQSVEREGCANPLHATLDQQEDWAMDDLQGINSSDAFLLLMPERHSHGAFFELGYVYSRKEVQGVAIHSVVSGGVPKRSIFTCLADKRVPNDSEALEHLCIWRRTRA